MKKCKDKKRVIRSLLLFVSLYSIGTVGMENDEYNNPFPIVCDSRLLRPEKKVLTIFNPKKELDIGRSWHEVIPGNMMITPDNKGVVFGVRGQVLYSPFDKEDNSEPTRLFKHSDVKHSPMIAMAQKKDGLLLIISAGNYKNSENKSVAEYIIYYNSDGGYSKTHELEWPIQAISLDSNGETLAIAGLYNVLVIDFSMNKCGSAVYKRQSNSKDYWIKDIAVKPEGRAVITVGNQNHEAIQWMNLFKDQDDDIDLKNIKQVNSNDVIEKIFYPSTEEFFYVTRDGKAKMFSFDALLTNNSVEQLSTVSFVDSSSYDIVVGDLSEQVATAHWTNNLKFPEDKRNKIEIYRKDKKNRCIDKFILEVADLEERYVYVTPLGQHSSGIGHLLNVALRGRHVVALASDGKMRLWRLPEKNVIYEQLDKKEEQANNEKLAEDKLNELKAASRPLSETKRSRSSSGTGVNRVSISMKTSDDEKPKKKSPRDILKAFSNSSSNPSSPGSSRTSSPGREKDVPKGQKSLSDPEFKFGKELKES